jgi:transcriptional regulator
MKYDTVKPFRTVQNCSRDSMKAKLTEKQVQELRQLKGQGWTNKELAFRFGITAATVSRIVNRRRRQFVS